MQGKKIYTAFRLIQEFRKLDDDITTLMASLFLRVVLNAKDGITMKQLGEQEGVSQASVSRNIAALSKWHRLHRPGLDLVEAMEDPLERRRKIVKLTPKGRRVAESISDLLEENEEA